MEKESHKEHGTHGAHHEDHGAHKETHHESRATEGFNDFVDAAKKGAHDAAKAAERTIPAVKQGISKGTYVFCYYLAFAAVYSACLAMEFVPEDSPIRHGFRDGADAANAAHKKAQHKESHHKKEHHQPA